MLDAQADSGGRRMPGECRLLSMWRLGVACALAVTPAAQGAGTAITTVRIASGLVRPLYVTHAPGDFARVFIVQQHGRIRVLRGTELLSAPFLDVDALSACCGERGLLGLAFHPDYARNGFFYVNYTDNNGDTVIARYEVSDDPDVADANSARTLLTIDQPTSQHNGGWLGFGPDGFLYIATGDGGPWFDPENRAQTTTGELLGKILRIDVDRDDWPADSTRNYGIPAGNPLVGTDGEDEIWAYGLRNPWRCAFDSASGDLYITDVGQGAWEEINVQLAGTAGGANYGWRCFEASECTSFGECDCTSLAATPPAYEYEHVDSGCYSVTGGEVYRGCLMPELGGTYFFADFCTDQIWSFRFDGGVTDFMERTSALAPEGGGDITGISSFGRDAFGEIYLCDLFDGEVFKIVPSPQSVLGEVARSEPPDLSIDARQPSEPDGTRPAGRDTVFLTYDGCVASFTAAEFAIVQEGGVDPAPAVVRVEPLAIDTLRVQLSHNMNPGAWTSVTDLKSGRGIKIGWLPGDVNADQRSDQEDIKALIDSLRGIRPRALRSTDLDRSGTAAPADILRVVDLLLGAGSYDEYEGASIP